MLAEDSFPKGNAFKMIKFSNNLHACSMTNIAYIKVLLRMFPLGTDAISLSMQTEIQLTHSRGRTVRVCHRQNKKRSLVAHEKNPTNALWHNLRRVRAHPFKRQKFIPNTRRMVVRRQ